MLNFGYNNRWVRLVKDLLFFALGCWLVSRGAWLAVLIGILAICWYGRDAYYQAKVLWQEKHFQPKDNTIRKENRPENGTSDSGKITVTDLSSAKEVDYQKE